MTKFMLILVILGSFGFLSAQAHKHRRSWSGSRSSESNERYNINPWYKNHHPDHHHPDHHHNNPVYYPQPPYYGPQQPYYIQHYPYPYGHISPLFMSQQPAYGYNAPQQMYPQPAYGYNSPPQMNQPQAPGSYPNSYGQPPQYPNTPVGTSEIDHSLKVNREYNEIGHHHQPNVLNDKSNNHI